MIKAEIDLTEKESDFLKAIAMQTGKTQSDVIRGAIERLISEFNRQIREESSKQQKISALKGKYAHVKTDSETFALRKQEDLYLEEHLCTK
jgi:predicted DNA-binding protein